MTLQEVDKKISELHILRKSLEKMEIRKFQEKAKKNVGQMCIRDSTHIEAGDRICQFRIEQHQPKLVFEVVDTLGNTDRGGIGSTGKR